MSGGRVSKAIVVMVGVVVMLTVGNGIAGAQTPPTLKTDASSYSSGARVTVTGNGWNGCGTLTVSLSSGERPTVLPGFFPYAGGFLTASFTAPADAGTYTLTAKAGGTCLAAADFVVTGNAGGHLASTGVSGPYMLVAASIAIAVGSAFVVAGRRSAS